MFQHVFSSNGTSSAYTWLGGSGTLATSGDMSGGTVNLEVSFDGGSLWHAAEDWEGADVVQAAPDLVNFAVGNCLLRVRMANGITPSVTVNVTRLDSNPLAGVDLSKAVVSNTNAVPNSEQITNIVRITQANYNALGAPDPTITYIIIP